METRNAIIFEGILALACWCLCLWFWRSVPDTAFVVSGYNVEGQALGHMGKTWGLLSGPVMLTGLTVVFYLLPKISSQFTYLYATQARSVSNVIALAGLVFTAEYGLRLMRLTGADQLHERGNSFFIFLLAGIFFANQSTKRNTVMSAREHKFARLQAWGTMISGGIAVVIFCLAGPLQSYAFFFAAIAIAAMAKALFEPKNESVE